LSNSPKTITCAAPVPTVTVSVNTTSITLGSSFTLTWSSTNATACTSYHGSSYSTGGTTSVTPPSVGTYTTGMQCTGPGGTSSMVTKTVNVSSVSAPTNNAPVGTHDGLGTVSACSTKGWAYDPDTSSASISVDIYKDGGAGSGTALGRFSANVSRSDVDTAKGITGNHGFDVDLTSYLSDGKSHSLYVYAIDSSGAGTNPLLSNSPKTITCPAPTGPGSGGSTSAPVSLNVTGTTIITKNVGQAYAVYWGSANVTSCTVTENGAQISSNCSPLGSPAAYNSYSVPKGKPASGIYLYVITATGSNGVTISSPAAKL